MCLTEFCTAVQCGYVNICVIRVVQGRRCFIAVAFGLWFEMCHWEVKEERLELDGLVLCSVVGRSVGRSLC
jgi:hypothetical protein